MRRAFLVVLAAAGAFVWLTSRRMPILVASHFGPGGHADGHMERSTYTLAMLVLVIAVPALIASSTLVVRLLPPQLVNLPNKPYRLAPERRAASLEALAALGLRFAITLAVFLCFVHWLVVQANAAQPARLPEAWFFAGLATFAAATLGWLISLFRRFPRVT